MSAKQTTPKKKKHQKPDARNRARQSPQSQHQSSAAHDGQWLSRPPYKETTKSLQQDAIIQLQQRYGNEKVQQMLTQSSSAAMPQIQRALTPAERAENLKSSKLAGDSRLEAAYDNKPTLRKGAAGNAVKKVQQALIDDGFDMPISTKESGSADGIFGKETKRTVRAFQAKHGLGKDGIVGRETLRKMDEIYGAAKPSAPKKTPEIEATEEAMGTHAVKKMDEANDGSTQSATSGIWYDFNYLDEHKKDPAKFPWDEDYRKGYTNSTYFERHPTKYWDWRLKPGVSASAGLKAWLKGLTITECLSTIVAIEIDALRAAIGDKKFDEKFGSTDVPLPETERLRIRPGSKGTPLEKNITATEAAATGDAGSIGKRPVKKGEWYYFYNHPKYLLKHPAGAFQGENAVYMGDNNGAGEQLWSGLGISNVTEDQMLVDMIGDYNDERTEWDYEKIVKYHTLAPITEASSDYEALYKKYIDRIDPKYRHDSGEFEDAVTKKDVLEDPPYKIGKTTRKGGFLVGAGLKLDAAKVKGLREE